MKFCLDSPKEVTYNGNNWKVGQNSIEDSKELCNVFQHYLGKFFCWLHTKLSKSYSAKVERALQSMDDALTKYQKAAQKTAKVAQETVPPKVEVKPEDPVKRLKRETAEKGEQIQKLQDEILRLKRSAWEIRQQEKQLLNPSIGNMDQLVAEQVYIQETLDNLDSYLEKRHSLEAKKFIQLPAQKRKNLQDLAELHKKHPVLEQVSLSSDWRDQSNFVSRLHERRDEIKKLLTASFEPLEASHQAIRTKLNEMETEIKVKGKLLATTKTAQINNYKELQQYTKEPIPELEPQIDPLAALEQQLEELKRKTRKAKDEKSTEYPNLQKQVEELEKQQENEIRKKGEKELRFLRSFIKNPQFIEDADKACSLLLPKQDQTLTEEEALINLQQWEKQLSKIYDVYLNKKPSGDDFVDVIVVSLEAIDQANPEKGSQIRQAIKSLPPAESDLGAYGYYITALTVATSQQK